MTGSPAPSITTWSPIAVSAAFTASKMPIALRSLTCSPRKSTAPPLSRRNAERSTTVASKPWRCSQ